MIFSSLIFKKEQKNPNPTYLKGETIELKSISYIFHSIYLKSSDFEEFMFLVEGQLNLYCLMKSECEYKIEIERMLEIRKNKLKFKFKIIFLEDYFGTLDEILANEKEELDQIIKNNAEKMNKKITKQEIAKQSEKDALPLLNDDILDKIAEKVVDKIKKKLLDNPTQCGYNNSFFKRKG